MLLIFEFIVHRQHCRAGVSRRRVIVTRIYSSS